MDIVSYICVAETVAFYIKQQSTVKNNLASNLLDLVYSIPF